MNGDIGGLGLVCVISIALVLHEAISIILPQSKTDWIELFNGPLAREGKLRARMRRECRKCFPTTGGKRSQHASRHVRDARAVMHAGIAN